MTILKAVDTVALPEVLNVLESLINLAANFPSELHRDHPDVVNVRAVFDKVANAESAAELQG